MSERLDGLHNDRYYTEGFRGGARKMRQIRVAVGDVLTQAFRNDLAKRHGGEAADEIMECARAVTQDDIATPYTSGVLLREHRSNQIVGFTYAIPALASGDASGMYKQEEDYRGKELSPAEYFEMQQRTAEVGYTAIQEEHRGKGGWTLMMNNLEYQLDRGNISHVTRFVRTENGYSEKIKSRYGNRIEYAQAYTDSFMGPQMYFRTKLK